MSLPNTGVSVRQALAGFTYLGATAAASFEMGSQATSPETNARLTDARDTFWTVCETEERAS